MEESVVECSTTPAIIKGHFKNLNPTADTRQQKVIGSEVFLILCSIQVEFIYLFYLMK